MDATRTRRTRDPARQTWYASHRQRRFARFLGFLSLRGPDPERIPSTGPAIPTRRREASFVTTAFDMCMLLQ